MTQLRQNPVTGRWVAIAPQRGGRPSDHKKPPKPAPASFVPTCPFCPGQEEQLPGILYESAATAPDAPWGCRVVPNLYPAFVESTSPGGAEASGFQEVIIDSPFHDRDPSRMDVGELVGLLTVYQRRLEAAVERLPGGWPHLFRNQGRDAGASLEHPHSQLIVVQAAAPILRERAERLDEHHRREGASLVDRAMDAWQVNGGTVMETRLIRAAVPFAAESPFETWIAAKDPDVPFVDLGLPELEQLAAVLGSVLRAYRLECGDPPYNLMLHTPQLGTPQGGANQWHLVLRTRVGRLAGFELSSGVYINPSSPEADAEYLRSVVHQTAPIREKAQIGE